MRTARLLTGRGVGCGPGVVAIQGAAVWVVVVLSVIGAVQRDGGGAVQGRVVLSITGSDITTPPSTSLL